MGYSNSKLIVSMFRKNLVLKLRMPTVESAEISEFELPEQRQKATKYLQTLLQSKQKEYFSLIDTLPLFNHTKLAQLFDTLSACVSSLSQSHSILINALLTIKGFEIDLIYNKFSSFIQNLVSAQAIHSKAVIAMIVSSICAGKLKFV